MSKIEKLLQEVIKQSKNLRFDQIRKILVEYLGYEEQKPRSGSSHVTFRKAGEKIITIPQKTPVKKVYVKMLMGLLKEQEEADEKKS